MGDRLATIDMGRKLGAVALLGELDPHVTQCGLGPRPTFVPSGILIHPAAVWPQRHGPEIGGEGPLLWEGELGPHLAQRKLGRGLPPY